MDYLRKICDSQGEEGKEKKDVCCKKRKRIRMEEGSVYPDFEERKRRQQEERWGRGEVGIRGVKKWNANLWVTRVRL